MPIDDDIREYRRAAAANAPPFLLPRRFIAAASWTKAATQGGARYAGLLREYEPDLPAILVHKQLLILGEPGAGKSTATKAIVHHILTNGKPTDVPVVATLKSYDGDLRTLLLRDTPAAVLDAPHIARTYILDGIDEVPANHRGKLRHDLDALPTVDAVARLVLTARQAFYAHHPLAFPEGVTPYHLLDFDDQNIRAYLRHFSVDADAFLAAVRNADCEEEICNPFVLDAMLKRFKDQGSLSAIRSDNVGFVVDQLIHTRPLVNAMRQRRALRMLAITCETAARNELTEEEALRVLHEAIELPAATAQQLLDELCHSILIKIPGRVSFQMRSHSEYLAAEELHDKSIDRLKELAFLNNTPVDTWLNTITYLAEMNHKVRQYFAREYPAWLVNISPAALTEDERTALSRQLLGAINQRQTYIVEDRANSSRRLARILTEEVIAELRAQLASAQPHEAANALVLLGILRQREIVPQALQRATEHRNSGSLRYSAIVALINVGEAAVLNDLIDFAQPGDDYYILMVDAIGSLCTPADFPRVLPLLHATNAGLSSAFYHFREFKTKVALVAAIEYLTANPGTLDGFGLDPYLEPLIDLIPEHWGNDIATALGMLLARLERAHFHRGKLVDRIIKDLAALDCDATALRVMISELARDGTRLQHIDYQIASLITTPAALWIAGHAAQYAQDLAPFVKSGPARNILVPQSPQGAAADELALARHLEQERRREQRIVTTRGQHQQTIRVSRDINTVIDACLRLQQEHWPEIVLEQRDWLAQVVNDTLERLDLANSITWLGDNRWTRPSCLDPLLGLTDYYNLRLANDVPIVLALRSWSDKAIADYWRRHGLSAPAQDQLAELLRVAEHDSITRNVLNFLRETEYGPPPIQELLFGLALDNTRTAELRIGAMERIGTTHEATVTFARLANDPEPGVREHAFLALVRLQDRPTISRSLAVLTDAHLQAGEVPFPSASPLDWIGTITTPTVTDELRALRQRTLALNLWRVSGLVTATIASIDKQRAVATIRQQLPQTPIDWRTHFRAEADKLERAARTEAVQQTPFELVIKKLKGATSMIRIKVWCEGSTDRPIFRTLFRELHEDEIAQTLDFVGGWPNLVTEQEPERWLDGCRQAAIIMDGDQGRKLAKTKKPLTDQAKNVGRRFAGHPIKLHVLQRYGVENYLPRHACEAILRRDLAAFFPIPANKKIDDHFCEPRTVWPRWLNRIRRQQPTSFYQKRVNEQAALHISMADFDGTDLAEIVKLIQRAAEDARQY